MCRELVAKVANMFKNFMQIFSPKYFARRSCDSRTMFAQVPRQNFGKFEMQNFRYTHMNVNRQSRDSLEKSGEKIKLSNIHTKVVRHSHECLTTVVGMKISYIRGKRFHILRLSFDIF